MIIEGKQSAHPREEAYNRIYLICYDHDEYHQPKIYLI